MRFATLWALGGLFAQIARPPAAISAWFYRKAKEFIQ